jgi:DNA-binding beta-propeller fold protein YncE
MECGARIADLSALKCPACGVAVVLTPVPGPAFGGGLPERLTDVRTPDFSLSDSGLTRLPREPARAPVIRGTHTGTLVSRLAVPDTRPLCVAWRAGTLSVLALDAQGRLVILRGGTDGLALVGPVPLGPDARPIEDPAGLAVDADGGSYVLDGAGCRILATSPSGTFARAFGQEGTEPGELSFPRAVDVSPAGLVVADTGNNRVQGLAREGGALFVAGAEVDEDDEIPSGSAPGLFDGPAGIGAAPDGQIFVADTNNHRIQVLDSGGEYASAFGVEGEAPGRLLFPGCLRVGRGGDVFVLDLHGRRIQKFAPTGAFVWGFLLESCGPELGGASAGFDVGDDETLYVPVPSKGVVVACRKAEA